MSDRMPERMSYKMTECIYIYMSHRMNVTIECQIECQIEFHGSCQTESQIERQNI